MAMRLIGARNMAEVVPGMVDTRLLNSAGGTVTMYDENCKHHQSGRVSLLIVSGV